jgi:hypothetical protein
MCHLPCMAKNPLRRLPPLQQCDSELICGLEVARTAIWLRRQCSVGQADVAVLIDNEKVTVGDEKMA